jgi:hypothetical protein
VVVEAEVFASDGLLPAVVLATIRFGRCEVNASSNAVCRTRLRGKRLQTKNVTFLGIVLAGASAQGIEPSNLFLIQKGPMLLKPQFDTTIGFTDNINYAGDGDKLSDFSAIISPGFAVQFGAKDYNFIELSYFYDRIQYLEETVFDANQHRAAIELRFQKRRFTLEGTDRIESLSSPLGGGVSLEGQMVDRIAVANNYRLSYELSDRTGLYLGGTHNLADYQDDIALYDSQSLIGTLGFLYKAFSRTAFFGEIYYGRTTNDPNVPSLPDYPTANFIGGFLGARGNFTDKLSGSIKAGYETRDYDDNSASSGAPVVEASIIHRFTDATTAALTYSRRQLESVQFVRSTYVHDAIFGSLVQLFGSDNRLRGELRGGYFIARYEDSPLYVAGERSDDIITFGLTFTYDIRLWMRILAGYNFERLTSNEPSVVDYTVNRVTLGLELGY